MKRPMAFRVPASGRAAPVSVPAGLVAGAARPPAPRVRGTAVAALGALLGALLGSVAWIVVEMAGFVSHLPALAVAFLSAAGWDRFRGRTGASPEKGAAVALCTSAAIVAAERIALEAQLHESWLALGRLLPAGATDAISFAALRAATLAPDAPVWPAFDARLAVALGVGAAGCAGVVAAACGRRDEEDRPARSLAAAAIAATIPALFAATLVAFLPEGSFALGGPRATFRAEPFRLALTPAALAVSPAPGGGVRVPVGIGELPAPEGFAPAAVPDAPPLPDLDGMGETVPVARFVRDDGAEATALLASATVWRRCDLGWFARACSAALAAAGGPAPSRREAARLDFAAALPGGDEAGPAARAVSLGWRSGVLLRLEVRARAPTPEDAVGRAAAACSAWADAATRRPPWAAEEGEEAYLRSELGYLASNAGPRGLLAAGDFGAPALRRTGIPRSLIFLGLSVAFLSLVVRLRDAGAIGPGRRRGTP